MSETPSAPATVVGPTAEELREILDNLDFYLEMEEANVLPLELEVEADTEEEDD